MRAQSSLARVCILTLALASQDFVVADEAQERAAVPIFAAPPTTSAKPAGPLSSASRPAVSLPLSTVTRQRLSARIESHAAGTAVSPAETATRTPGDGVSRVATAGAHMMDPFVVDDDAPPVIDVPVPRSRFLEAVKTGKLWRSASGKTEVFSFGERTRSGHGRITLGVSLLW